MKQTFTALLVLFACTARSQTLFTYGKNSVSKNEFLHAYNKNNMAAINTEKSYRDYLNLYIRFKLKVQAAYDAQLDTLSALQTEWKNFRSQIIDGFMVDKSSVRELVEEAFERSQRDLRVAAIYIPFAGGDTLAAYRKANEAWNKIQSGTGFDIVADAYSADPAVHSSHGYIGFITVFTLPYEFENIVYHTPVGKTARPYRGKTAYIIFKTTAERPAIGKMKASQILLGFMPHPTEKEKERKKLLADSIYQALVHGADFKEMVARYSNDIISYQSGGLLPEFGTGRYSSDFENAAFALASDSEISRPVLTAFGYHIIKRMERLPVNRDKNNQAAMARLEQTVQADKRIQVARQILAKRVLRSRSFALASFNEKAFLLYADSIYAGKNPRQEAVMNDKTVLFSFAGKKFTASGFAAYIRGIRNVPELLRGKSTPQLLQQYAETQAMEYYRDHLELYNPEFAGQLKEFKEGNLLFEIMQRQVWDKAAGDSVALAHFYSSHKDKYWWEPSADLIVFTCSDAANAARARKSVMASPQNWRALAQPADGTVQADSARFELSQLPFPVSSNTPPGEATLPVKNDNATGFAYVVKTYPDRMPRNFEEARGFVINDYQAYLEERWLTLLKKKYPLKINAAVLQQCWK